MRMTNVVGAIAAFLSLGMTQAFSQAPGDPPALCSEAQRSWAMLSDDNIEAMQRVSQRTPPACRLLRTRMSAAIERASERLRTQLKQRQHAAEVAQQQAAAALQAVEAHQAATNGQLAARLGIAGKWRFDFENLQEGLASVLCNVLVLAVSVDERAGTLRAKDLRVLPDGAGIAETGGAPALIASVRGTTISLTESSSQSGYGGGEYTITGNSMVHTRNGTLVRYARCPDDSPRIPPHP